MKIRSVLLYTLSLITLLQTSVTFAKTNCGDLSEIKEIKNIVLCQSQPGLAACLFTGSALAFGVLGSLDKRHADLAVAKIWDELEAKKMTAINLERRSVATKLAENAYRGVASGLADKVPSPEAYRKFLEMNADPHADPKLFVKDPGKAIGRATFYKKLLEAGGKPPALWPVFREIGGEFVDIVNTPFDKLPESVREGYIKQVMPVVNQVFDHGMSGKPITPAFLNQIQQDLNSRYYLDRSFFDGSGLPKDVRQPQLPTSRIADPFCRTCAKDAAAAFQEVVAEADAKKMKVGAILANRAAMRFGMGAAMGLAGATLLTGGALTVLGYLADSTPTFGCTGEYEYQIYMNRQGNQCDDVYEIDDKVAKFLNLPEDQQLKLLSTNPDLCEYYRKFLREWRGEHKIVSAIPGDRTCTFRTQSRGKSRVHTVIFDDKGQVLNVNIQMGDSAFDPRVFYGMDNGNFVENLAENMTYNESKRIIGDLKLYLPAAIGCCAKPSIPALAKTCSGQEALTAPDTGSPGAFSTY